jgi:hypothetical protein
MHPISIKLEKTLNPPPIAFEISPKTKKNNIEEIIKTTEPIV